MEQETTQFNEIINYNLSEKYLGELKSKYLNVIVTDFDDKEGYEVAKQGHIEIKSLKAKLEARRKDLKADALKFGRMVDSEYNKVIAPLLDIEEHLKAQRAVIDDEVKRRKDEEEKAKQAKIEYRINEMSKLGAPISLVDATNWTDPHFESALEVAKRNFEESEKIRVENEEKRRQWEEDQAKKNIELEKREREIRAKELEFAKAREEEARQAREALRAKEEAEAQARKAQAEAEAKLLAESQDKELMQSIITEFDTLAKCHAEIFRLRKC